MSYFFDFYTIILRISKEIRGFLPKFFWEQPSLDLPIRQTIWSIPKYHIRVVCSIRIFDFEKEYIDSQRSKKNENTFRFNFKNMLKNVKIYLVSPQSLSLRQKLVNLNVKIIKDLHLICSLKANIAIHGWCQNVP